MINLLMKIFLVAVFLINSECFAQSKALRIGINPWPGYDFLYLAESKGFFKQFGANVKLINFAALSDMNDAFKRGQLDGMATNIVDAYFLHARGSDKMLQVVLAIDYSMGADMIISRPGIKNIKDLKGKKVGLEIMSLGAFVLNRALAKQNLTPKDVKLILLSQPELVTALKEKKVDAIVSYPPFSVEALKITGVSKIFSSAEIPGEILDVLVMKEDVIISRPKEIESLIKAFYEALKFRENNKNEADAIMAKHGGISINEWRESFSLIKVFNSDEFKNTLKNGASLVEIAQNVEKAMSSSVPSAPAWNIQKVLEPVRRFQGNSQ